MKITTWRVDRLRLVGLIDPRAPVFGVLHDRWVMAIPSFQVTKEEMTIKCRAFAK